MKGICIYFFTFILCFNASIFLHSQNSYNSIDLITSADLESYISFLASPLLKGRQNGELGVEIAARFIATQAKLSGLKPANGNSYFQPYHVIKKSFDQEKSKIQVVSINSDTITVKEPIYQLFPSEPSDLVIEGQVVFAGYGIKDDNYQYNDFKNLTTENKILLLLDKAPMSEDGKKSQFEDWDWSSSMNYQIKLSTLILSKPKAILFVSDPKSGFQSFEESFPDITYLMRSTYSLKGEMEEATPPFMHLMPKVFFIHRSVADALLKGTGHSLEELQRNIDATLKPHSFSIKGKKIIITRVSQTEEILLNNVAGYIEGSDHTLKNEVIVFSSHYDHIGSSGNKINTGADDDASGCASLLSIAEAYQSLEIKPLRSVLFLWLSGEEIGLFGSKSYVNDPLFPLEKTVANLNIDMVGRVKEIADSTEETPMSGPGSIFVITDNQSDELKSIADEIDRISPLDFDYSLSGKNHPLQLFARSDHYNFVQKDIPVLFFTSGLHSDYHTPRDNIDKIDFHKLEMVTRTIYKIGLTVANKKDKLIVNNPFSSWEKIK